MNNLQLKVLEKMYKNDTHNVAFRKLLEKLTIQEKFAIIAQILKP